MRPYKKPIPFTGTATYYDVTYKKGVESKNYFVKLGVAFPDAETGRIKLKLDALPLNTWDGELWLFPKTGTFNKREDNDAEERRQAEKEEASETT